MQSLSEDTKDADYYDLDEEERGTPPIDVPDIIRELEDLRGL